MFFLFLYKRMQCSRAVGWALLRGAKTLSVLLPRCKDVSGRSRHDITFRNMIYIMLVDFCKLIPLVGKHAATTFLLLKNKTVHRFCFSFFSVLLHRSFRARRSEAPGAALWGGAGRERVDGSHSPSQVGVMSRSGWGSSRLPVLWEDFVIVRWYHLGPFLFLCEGIVCHFHGCAPVKDKDSRHEH